MRERVAASDAREQERGARIGLEMARMGGKPRQEQQGAPVRVGRDAGEARKRRALRIERGKRAAARAAQQGFRQGQGVEFRRGALRARIFLFGGAACHSVFLGAGRRGAKEDRRSRAKARSAGETGQEEAKGGEKLVPKRLKEAGARPAGRSGKAGVRIRIAISVDMIPGIHPDSPRVPARPLRARRIGFSRSRAAPPRPWPMSSIRRPASSARPRPPSPRALCAQCWGRLRLIERPVLRAPGHAFRGRCRRGAPLSRRDREPARL